MVNFQILSWMIEILIDSMPQFETKLIMFCILTLLSWGIVMDDWNLDEISLTKWQILQHGKSIMAKLLYEEWQLMVGLH